MIARAHPVQVRCRILATDPYGSYRRLVLDAPAVATSARPGQFVAVAVGGDRTSMLLRRAFAIYRVTASAVEVIVAAHGPGTQWLTQQQPGTEVDVVGPLGRPFPIPDDDGPVVVGGGGYGTAAVGTLIR